MSAATFKKGDEVYDIHGRAASYVARVSGGHVVEPIYEQGDDEPPYLAEAVTWRDVFAAKAMAALLGSQLLATNEGREVVKTAYAVADAMLEARKP